MFEHRFLNGSAEVSFLSSISANIWAISNFPWRVQSIYHYKRSDRSDSFRDDRALRITRLADVYIFASRVNSEYAWVCKSSFPLFHALRNWSRKIWIYIIARLRTESDANNNNNTNKNFNLKFKERAHPRAPPKRCRRTLTTAMYWKKRETKEKFRYQFLPSKSL